MIEKNNKGVSLPAVIIIIIVLVMLAYITMQNSTSIITKAEYADFLEEIKTIEDKSRVMQFGLSKEKFGSNTYEGLNYKKAKVIDPPWNFESFDEDGATGYVVDLETLSLNYIVRGRQPFVEDGIVTFGQDDLFIIDKNGKVFYTEAEDSGSGLYFNVDTKKPVDSRGPTIEYLDYSLINNNTEAEIIINVLPIQGGNVSVYVGNKRAEDLGNNEFRATVRKTGVCYIHANEIGGGITYTSIDISGISSSKGDETPPTILEFICAHENGTNVIKVSAYDEESKIVGYSVSTSSSDPTSWTNCNKITLQTSQVVTESGTYYLYVKNGVGLTTSQSLIVDLNYNYVITYDLNGGIGDIDNQVVVRGRSVNIPSVIPEKDGYQFQGWAATQGGAVIYRAGDSIIPDGDMTLYAIYAEASMYDVVLNPNGGTLGNIPGIIYGKQGEDVMLPSNEPTKMFHKFIGWGSVADAEEPDYYPGEKYKAGKSMELYAIWQLDIFLVDDNGIITGIKEEAVSELKNDDTTSESPISKIKIPKVIDGKVINGIGSFAFAELNKINSVIVPNTINSIGDFAFYACSGLISVKLPDGLANISEYTFYNCISLQQINIPARTISIGEGSFLYCRSLERLELPNSVNSIGFACFSGCSSLQEINIPSGVTRMENSVFKDCSSLREIVIPSGVTNIGDSAFYNCTSLIEITIPENVSSMAETAFGACINLESLNILSRNLTKIPDRTCLGCSNLTSVSIPDGITIIGENAFENCIKLNNLVIPDSVTKIYDSAFSGCLQLELHIPSTVTYIRQDAFFKVPHIYYSGSATGSPWGAKAIN